MDYTHIRPKTSSTTTRQSEAEKTPKVYMNGPLNRVPIKAVLFDLGNTLSVSASLADSFADLAGSQLAIELGLDAPILAELGKDIDQSIAGLYREDSTDQPHWRDVWRRSVDRYGIKLSPTDIERLCRAHIEHFVSCCVVAPHTVPLLRYLRGAGIPSGLVSNVTGPVEIFQVDLDQKGLTPYFGVIVWSGSAGYRKPDRRIFEIALNSLGFEAGPHIAMVGDSEEADIVGGKGLGLTTVKVVKNKNDSNTVADFSVTGVELLETLRSGIEVSGR